MDLELQALWRALQPLRSVASFLMVGAHPDDEWNGFLGWLAYGRGVRTIYACSTRGEGGQSVLGPERGRALAALRSREMERSAAEIDLTLRWIGAGGSHGVDDPMFDFGFSRSGVDTLQRWGEERLVRRLVTLIRTERPDGLSPTFLDVPGQHGHHRAMTQSTLRAFDLAADPAYAVEALAPWRVTKLYLPARSGAGGSYDDELPPPAETVRVDLGEPCPALGVNWAQLGERSRLYHASQGMGRTLADGARPFPLHLLAGSPDTALPMDGLVHSLADLAGTLPAGEAQDGLMVADAAINDALSAFPDKARVAGALHAALGALQGLAWPDGAANLADRILLKQRQLGRAAALALGIGARIEMPQVLQAGGQFPMIFSVNGPAQASLRLPAGWSADIAAGRGGTVSIPAETSAFGTQRDGYDPLGGNEAVGVDLIWTHAGSAARIQVDPPLPLALAPHADVVVQPQRVVRREASGSDVILRLSGGSSPASWPIACAAADGFVVRAQPGRTMLETAGQHLMRIQAPHGGEVAILEQAEVQILRLPIAIASGNHVGVAAGISDETLDWLRQLDISAEALDDEMLAHGDLGRFTTIVVGLFGFGQRPALLAHRDRLMRWVENGGSLITMYHRPEDGWNEGRTPPLPLLPGRPSLRWRVTDPAAEVTVLEPEHVLLNWPNAISDADWQGWVRERGLYFAASWDPAYTPLIELGDLGQPQLQGALLVAPVERGRHVHVALALHHQFRALIPGAFRLLANLVATPESGG